MGCSTSSPSTGEAAAKPKSTSTNRAAVAPAAGGADAATVIGESDAAMTEVASGAKYPASQAFVIPLDDDARSTVMESYEPTAPQPTPSLSKKPPKRIQELMEQAATSTEQPLNREDLEEKLNKAEMRRKEFLQQKIENIQKITQQQQLAMSRHSEAADLSRAAALGLDLTARDIEKKALDDDSKQELLTSTLRTQALH